MATKGAKKGGAEDGQAVAPRLAVQRSFAKANKELGKTLRGEDAVYRIPWYGMIGDPSSRKEDLLPAAGLNARQGSPFLFGLSEESANRWWFFNAAVVLDFCGGYFGETGTEDEEKASGGMFSKFKRGGGETQNAWKATLDSLKKTRRLRPLDGLVLCIDAASLRAQTPEDWTALARRAESFAERVHEAQHRLGVHMPIYVVLTNSEGLPGFDVYANAMPEPMRDQIFGWSTPHEPEVAYAPEWVDEAIDSVHEAVCTTQLDLMTQLKVQSQRDDLYLLPRELQRLRKSLRVYLDPIFKGTTFRRGLPLRGIYFTGRIEAAKKAAPPTASSSMSMDPLASMVGEPPSAGGSGDPSFVKQLFSEKIFLEPGLAVLDDDQRRALGKKTRWARIGLVAMLLTCITGLLVAAKITSGRLEKFIEVESLLKEKAQGGDPEGVLPVLAGLEVDGFETALAPTVYVESLREDTDRAVNKLVDRGFTQRLRSKLKGRADLVLPEKPVLKALDSPDPRFHLQVFDEFAVDIIKLKVHFDHYQKHETEDVAELYGFVYDQQGTEQVERLKLKTELYMKALRGIRWEPLPYGSGKASGSSTTMSYRRRARLMVSRYAARFQRELFNQHPILDRLHKVEQKINELGEPDSEMTLYQRLRFLEQELTALQSSLRDVAWLGNREFKAEGYDQLIDHLNQNAFGSTRGSSPESPDAAGRELRARNQTAFLDLRRNVCADLQDEAEDREGQAYHLMLICEGGKVRFGKDLRSVHSKLRALLRRKYASALETDGALKLQDSTAETPWNTRLIAEILRRKAAFAKDMQASAESSALVDLAVRTAAHEEFRRQTRRILRTATPEMVAKKNEEAGNWSIQRKEVLKKRVTNLADEFDNVVQISTAMQKVDAFLDPTLSAEVEGSRLYRKLAEDASGLLGQVRQVLVKEKLYTVRDDDVNWWDGDRLPGVIAFGARDKTDLNERLRVQRQTLKELSQDYAQPVVEKMMASSMGDTDAEWWNELVGILGEYEKKTPGNSIEELERFIEEDLNKLQLASCKEQLKDARISREGDDFFKGKKSRIANLMARRCEVDLKRQVLEGYVGLQIDFRNNLAGRFPFSGPDTLAEVETGQVVEFFRKYDESASAFAALLKSQRNPFGPSTADVKTFLELLRRTRPLFAALLTSEEENPDLTLDLRMDFRVNRESESGGNQIIQWWVNVGDLRVGHRDPTKATQWRSNDPVAVCFQWASNSTYQPAADQKAVNARVDGRKVCFAYEGRWALLRTLAKHQAKRADLRRQSFLRPHTLRFVTETSLSKSAESRRAGIIGDDTRVYVRIGVMLPGGKSAYQIRDFPRRAPELPMAFLKQKGIQVDRLLGPGR